jgi:hypothetical protein
MKKTMLLVASLLTAALSQSQIINPDFTTWHTNFANASAMDPNSGIGNTGWWDFNVLSGSGSYGSSPVSVFQDNTTVYTGDTYSCKIETVVLTATSHTFISAYGNFPDTIGLLFCGNENGTGKYTPKEPFTQRISSFNFEYQYAPVGKDTGFAVVALYHFSGGKSNQLGFGVMELTTAASWTLAQVPIFWDSTTGNPDSILVEFSSSNLDKGQKPMPGSTLWLDHVTTSLPAGINEVSAADTKVSVYPNPASTEVNFSISGEQAYKAEMYDITGQKMNTYNIVNNSLRVNTSGYATGLYFYKIYDQTGNLLNIGKLCISK